MKVVKMGPKFLLLLSFGAVLSTSFGYYTDCKIKDLDLKEHYNKIVNEPIDDTYSGELFKINLFNLTGFSFFSDYYSDPFINATQKDGFLVIETTKHFSRFEEMFSSTSRDVELLMEIYLNCDDGMTLLDFYQPINDVNNHDPTFNRKIYKYKFGMPIKKDLELTRFMEVYAVDIDVTNTNVLISFDPPTEDLEIVSKTPNFSNYKIHNVKIVTKRDFPSGTYEYSMVVQDEGTPRKSTKAKILIEID